MPELPEVEYARKLAERVALGRRLDELRCDDDEIVFEGVPPAEVKCAVEGRTVRALRRHGKQLWFEFDGGPCLLIHLGMTGHIRTPGARRLKLAADAAGEPEAWPPRFLKLHFVFDDGGELAFTNARRFGRVRVQHDPTSQLPVSALGFDLVVGPPSTPEFIGLLAGRRGAIKSLLLKQSVLAGVGNWIADEALYQAAIAPARRAGDLSIDEAEKLLDTLLHVVQFAISVQADKRRFPQGWLFHHRWGKDTAATTGEGEVIEFLTIGGRTTAWVPSRQR